MSAHSQYSSFRVGGQLFGVDVAYVQEVVRPQPLTRVPLAPAAVVGLMNLRGQIVTVLDLRTQLGLPARPSDEAPVIIVVRSGEEVVGLMADRAGDVVDTTGHPFEPPPETLEPPGRHLVSGTYQLPNQLLLVLDVEHAVRVQPAA